MKKLIIAALAASTSTATAAGTSSSAAITAVMVSGIQLLARTCRNLS